MPLAFKSESHGTIAFGFFNIHSDLLLLDHYFMFATDFCETIYELISSEQIKVTVPAYIIEKTTKSLSCSVGISPGIIVTSCN